MDIDVLESLLRPENFEVSLKYVLEHATSRGSNIFQLFDTSESRTTSLQAQDDGWEAREETVHCRRMDKTSGMALSMKELRQKLCCAPTPPCRLPFLSKARGRLEKEKIIGSLWKTGESEGLHSRTWPREC